MNEAVTNAGGEKARAAAFHDARRYRHPIVQPAQCCFDAGWDAGAEWQAARIAELEAELARVAPFLALHGFEGYGTDGA